MPHLIYTDHPSVGPPVVFPRESLRLLYLITRTLLPAAWYERRLASPPADALELPPLPTLVYQSSSVSPLLSALPPDL